jgi:hypothetical protein
VNDIYFPLSKAVRFWPGEKPASVKKLKHAILVGKRSRRDAGAVIRLEAVHDGSRFLVTEAAIREFIDAVTFDRSGPAARQQKRINRALRTTVNQW